MPKSAIPAVTPVQDLLKAEQFSTLDNATFQVFDLLRDLIVSTKLLPGQRISDKEIASSLQVGRTPVREALIRLDELNLVQIVPQSGTYVTKISVNRYSTACFIRLHLEVGAVQAAASAPDPRFPVSELERLNAAQEEALANDDYDTFIRLDEAFHQHIFQIGGCGDVWTTARRTQFDLNRARHIRRKHRVKRGPEVLREHQAIIDAIKAHDPDAAAAAMRAHIGDVDRQVGQLFTDERLNGLIELPEAN